MSPPSPAPRPLVPVRVDAARVARHIVGLRPFRTSGFRVEAERIGDQTIVHDYGHGGGGVSLSWGTAELALELALRTPHRSAAVLGCGAVGLATARLLQQRVAGVTIYARELPPATTSNVAGAVWLPTTVCDDDRATAEFTSRYERATELAFRAFERLVGARYGVRWLDGWALSDTPEPGVEWQSPTIARLLPATPMPRGTHPFPSVPHVFRFPALHIDTGVYLAALLDDFRAAGGRVVQRAFARLDEARALPEPLVMNCTGFGAGAMCADRDVLPIKGQLVVLQPQPEIDYVTFGPGPGMMYSMPRRDGVVLGGTFERGVSTLHVDEAQAQDLLAKHQRLFGELFDARAAR